LIESDELDNLLALAENEDDSITSEWRDKTVVEQWDHCSKNKCFDCWSENYAESHYCVCVKNKSCLYTQRFLKGNNQKRVKLLQETVHFENFATTYCTANFSAKFSSKHDL